jgi:hypothetical protein
MGSFQLQCSSHSEACMAFVLPVTLKRPVPSSRLVDAQKVSTDASA